MAILRRPQPEHLEFPLLRERLTSWGPNKKRPFVASLKEKRPFSTVTSFHYM
ncbi:MAG: hypothetical protein AAF614_19135 [Chloroflexota bacterium]